MKQNLKNYLKFGILLFGICLFVINCQSDDVTFDDNKELNVKTVSFDEAKAFFENNNTSQYAQRGTSDLLVLNPDWNTIQHSDLAYSDAELTKAETDVNRLGNYESKLIFLNINEIIRSVIITTWTTEYDTQNNILNANVYINEYDGTFIDGYKIEDGLFTKRIIVESNTQTAGFLSFLQNQLEDDDCWNTDLLPDDAVGTQELSAVTVSGPSGGSSSSSTGNGLPLGTSFGIDYGGYLNGAAGSTGGGGTLGVGLPSSKVDKALAAVVLNPPSDNNTLEEEEEEQRRKKCEELQQIANNGNFTQRMQELRTATTGNKEIQYYGIRDNDGNMNYADEDRVEGDETYEGVHAIPDHVINNPVDSAIHNHFLGALPVFSPGDLYSLYHLYDNNLIVDTSTFIMYVTTTGNSNSTTDDDTLYAITISDTTQFQVNGALFLSDEDAIGSFYYHKGINPNISTSLNEQRFLELIKERNLGLTLYKGDKDNFSNWSQLKLKNDNSIKSTNCN
tara:strand:+ start:193 stop:1710 length:1518 start_codon:yes stop_codon:yes gene_type:complete